MKKQTAVEWLHYHLLHLMQTKEWRSKDLHVEKFDELFIEALAMEREQILQAYREGRTDEQSTMPKWNNRAATCYYNQTYQDESKG